MTLIHLRKTLTGNLIPMMNQTQILQIVRTSKLPSPICLCYNTSTLFKLTYHSWLTSCCLSLIGQYLINQSSISRARIYYTSPIALLSDFRRRTSENSEIRDANFLVFTLPLMNRTSGDFDNFRALIMYLCFIVYSLTLIKVTLWVFFWYTYWLLVSDQL